MHLHTHTHIHICYNIYVYIKYDCNLNEKKHTHHSIYIGAALQNHYLPYITVYITSKYKHWERVNPQVHRRNFFNQIFNIYFSKPLRLLGDLGLMR